MMAALAEIREAAGLSRRQLSIKLRRSENFAQYVETGQRQINVCELLEWIDKCGADRVQVLHSIAGK